MSKNQYLLSRAYQLFVGELNLGLWKRLYLNSEHYYLRKKLLAIKYLYEGKSTKEVSRLLQCSEKKLSQWIDKFLIYGLEGLIFSSENHLQKQRNNRTCKLHETPIDWGLWQYIYDNCGKEYQKKRLLAIRYLYEGKSRRETSNLLNCNYKTLSNWIDKFISGGLEKLIEPVSRD